MEFVLIFEETQPTGYIKNRHEIVNEDPCNFGLKISENEKIFLNFADF